jgi:hypothetical protein
LARRQPDRHRTNLCQGKHIPVILTAPPLERGDPYRERHHPPRANSRPLNRSERHGCNLAPSAHLIPVGGPMSSARRCESDWSSHTASVVRRGWRLGVRGPTARLWCDQLPSRSPPPPVSLRSGWRTARSPCPRSPERCLLGPASDLVRVFRIRKLHDVGHSPRWGA